VTDDLWNEAAAKPLDPRPDWSDWALGLAVAAARRGDCTRRQVGAVILDAQHRVAGVGYNGAPSGQPGCLTAGACPRGRMSKTEVVPGSAYDTGAGACIAVHAEQNAILDAPPWRREGGTIYISCEPCDGCWRLIWGAGLARAVWPDGSKLRP
jgi:dCMP deaminase